MIIILHLNLCQNFVRRCLQLVSFKISVRAKIERHKVWGTYSYQCANTLTG
jgi:hypothetical protein